MGLTLPPKCKVNLVLGHPYSDTSIVPAMVEMAKGMHEYALNRNGVLSPSVRGCCLVAADLLRRPVQVVDMDGGTLDVCWIEFDEDEG